MYTDLESLKDDQGASDSVHKVEAAQAEEIQDQVICRKRKLEDEIQPVRTAPTQVSSEGSICAKCLDLDLPGALQKATQIFAAHTSSDIYKTELWFGIHVANVDHQYQQHRFTNCALCSILFSARIGPERSKASEDGDEIRLLGLSNVLLVPDLVKLRPRGIFQEPKSPILAVVPRHFGSDDNDNRLRFDYLRHGEFAVLVQDDHHPEPLSAQEVPASFDSKVASGWLQYCKNNHSSLCGGSSKSSVSGLHLIDCTTLSIIEAERNSPYVALSYVWGKTGDIDSKIRRTSNKLLLPARLTSIVSDAISVTKALSFRYLWIDKFCIDQDDAVAKLEQINQMNVIYENADLTIVAAAGADETYGLPGVDQRPRTPQKTARFNGLSVITTLKDPRSLIRASHWASRGWTFQEAVLSRRRLVFTDEQLYFECNSMNCFESVYIPLDKIHVKNRSKSLDIMRAGMFGRGTTEAFGKLVPDKLSLLDVFQQFLSSIQDYSTRDLRFDTDSLNAFQGIIQRYSRLKRPVHAIWGLPYAAQGEERRSYFCWTLSWSHTQDSWENSRQPRRRKEFPSWTWAGWAGAVQIKQIEGKKVWSRDAIQSVKFGDRGDNAEDLDLLDFSTPVSKCRMLRLLAKTLSPSLFSCQPTADGKTSWAFNRFKAELLPSQSYMLEGQFVQELMDTGRWNCIWICSMLENIFCMLLERNDDADTWIRAGMFSIKCWYTDMYPPLYVNLRSKNGLKE
ncbi:hypothetical protein J7T55_013710 [Diaporthe amygdali]|uniref:uncharacterized protein n=1 Tax=Phomopsis amygdali TaxID=1214568 RepID=UPI0022FE0719|nr:uncharacterized protein J7T55_013710 [Diaporthe amygdali]KAJ0119508.1 hypothetical protein J7T55_013710 [Diaporthe amygdali]